MFIEFVYLSGTHKGEHKRFIFTQQFTQGQTEIFQDDVPTIFITNNTVSIGRHASSDISFDAHHDLAVSSHHAQITAEGGLFILSDLNSKNGTFIYGKSITKHVIKNEDVIEVGKGGPQLRCIISTEESKLEKTVIVPAVRDDRRTIRAGLTTIRQMVGEMLSESKGGKSISRTNVSVYVRQVVTQMVNKTSKRMQVAFIIMAAILILSLGGLLLQNMELRQKLEGATNQQKIELLSLEKQFQNELDISQQRVKSLRQQIEEARAGEVISSSQLKVLETLLASESQKTSDLGNVLRATRDSISTIGNMTKEALLSLGSFQQIAKENAEAIFMVCALDTMDNEVIPIGSGFAVREDGIILTNAHVAVELQRLFNQYSSRYKGIVVQNENYSHRFFIMAMGIHNKYDPTADYSPDMAWLRVNNNEGLKAVALATEEECQKIDKGYEVAVIGFPGLTMNPDNPVATFSRGAIGRIINIQYIQHDCQTSGGSSGSPILNKNGKVVAIHYGGKGNLSVLVPLNIPDTSGGTKQIIITKRIKEAVGLNEGIRADVIREFMVSIHQ